jgi:hypothetical protein
MKATGALLLSLLACAVLLAGKQTRAELLHPADITTSLLWDGLPAAAAVLCFHCTHAFLMFIFFLKKIQGSQSVSCKPLRTSKPKP